MKSNICSLRALLRNALLIGGALLIASPALRASPGCCGGVGAFGLDGRWTPLDLPPVPKKERIVSIHNASFGSTRDLYAEINATFGKEWVKKTNYSLTVNGTHGPSFAQTRVLLADKSDADFVTLDHPSAIDELALRGRFLPENWRTRLPNNSVPFNTTIVFLVRKGNPKAIRDWPDLAKSGVAIVTPDPKLNSVGQWIYLAAWSTALQREGGDVEKSRASIIELYHNVAVLNSNSDGAAQTFTEKKTGDVLLLLESEALALAALDKAYEVVAPPASLRVETPVAWLDKNIEKHGTARVTISYLMHLFSPEVQEIAVRHHYRPIDEAVAQKHASAFAPVKLLTLDETFGGWPQAYTRFLAPGAALDRDYPVMTTKEIIVQR